MSFEDTDFRREILDTENPFDIKLVTQFLKGLDFDYEPNEVEMTIILYNLNDDIIGTGSINEQTLKYVAVAPAFRETTAFPQIVTFLSNKILEKYDQCFVFTKPEKAILFESLGFSLLAVAKPLFSILEFGFKSIKDFQHYLNENKVDTKTDDVAGIVVNCNPFTKGHQWLIEKAASENELVYLFIVRENLSVFPYEMRKTMIENGISHLKNVKIVSTGPYIVSGAIFPDYFLKNESISEVSLKQAEIDVKIFAEYAAPILNIKKRYVGTEDYCHTTAAYNAAMKSILPEYGIELIELKRIALNQTEENDPDYISASKVRKAIKEGRMNEILDFLPESTKQVLLSEESAEIIEKIKASTGRH